VRTIVGMAGDAPPDDVTIRRIAAGDGPLLKLVRLRSLLVDPASFGSTHAREASQGDAEWSQRADRLAAGDDAMQLLALDAAGPVGTIVAVRDDDEPGLFHVYAMWVAPERRGSGLGARLLAVAETWIAAVGGNAAELSVTNAAPVAARLYARAGYERTGREQASDHTPGLVEHTLRKTF
jgi:GNAT superfamily N-acetyltransferase